MGDAPIFLQMIRARLGSRSSAFHSRFFMECVSAVGSGWVDGIEGLLEFGFVPDFDA